MSTFSGFSEEELNRIKSGETNSDTRKNISSQHSLESGPQLNTTNIKRVDKLGFKSKRTTNQYKLPVLQKLNSDDAIDNIQFDKCKLSLRSPNTVTNDIENNNESNKENVDKNESITSDFNVKVEGIIDNKDIIDRNNGKNDDTINRKELEKRDSGDVAPDIVRGVNNYSENELVEHRAKLEELQLRQKLMEEQNKKRKEMLAKALADRTKQTTEEVMRLEKIKKELQVLDSQFSQDVAVLRAKIDQACFSYADAEKHYLKVEKEFLQAKIHLQKEKEKKELLTEHLCALITHNETRKAQKLETLMLELATDKKIEVNEVPVSPVNEEDDKPVIVDGVDERTGKIVEFIPET